MTEPVLRVALVRSISPAASVTVQAPAGAKLTGDDGEEVATGPGTWHFTASSGSVAVRCDPDDETATAGLFRADPPDEKSPLAIVATGRVKPARYRGSLELRPASGDARLLVINIVPIEGYLRGVIGPEIGEDAPAEALKAQAICARTHALKSRGRYHGAPYDIRDTPDTQVYGGIGAEHATTDAAVRNTAGQVLTLNGKLIWGDYYDDCGGVTSPGTEPGDYPPSVVDRPDGGDTDYCARARNHTWTLQRTLDDLAKALPASVTAQTGSLSGIEVAETDSSGRVRRVRLTGESGTTTVTGADLRRYVGYTRLPSTLFTITVGEDGSVTLAGRGNGHGHGMCQQGAIGMVSAPYRATCAAILEHYFPGAKVAPFASLTAAGAVKAPAQRRSAPGVLADAASDQPLRASGRRP